jgi:hypothetical protein
MTEMSSMAMPNVDTGVAGASGLFSPSGC